MPGELNERRIVAVTVLCVALIKIFIIVKSTLNVESGASNTVKNFTTLSPEITLIRSQR